jgi:hypothetical protein
MADRHCRRCGAPLPARNGRGGPPALYCSRNCRRQAGKERDPDDGTDDASILATRRRLAEATWATRTCRCEHPLGVVDEDGDVRCVRCAYPLQRPSPVNLPLDVQPPAA